MKMRHLNMILVRQRKPWLARTGFCALGAVCVYVSAESSSAQGTVSATAAIVETGTAGSEFQYTLTLDNTGTVPINAFWYGWIQGSFDLPSVPTAINGPLGWSGSAFSDSIQFGNSTGSAIAPGTSGTFTFDSTSNPTALTSGTTDNAPTGDSVAYANVSAMQGFDQSDPGIASNPFVPSLTTVPEPSTVGLMATGLTSVSFWMAKRRRA